MLEDFGNERSGRLYCCGCPVAATEEVLVADPPPLLHFHQEICINFFSHVDDRSNI